MYPQLEPYCHITTYIRTWFVYASLQPKLLNHFSPQLKKEKWGV